MQVINQTEISNNHKWVFACPIFHANVVRMISLVPSISDGAEPVAPGHTPLSFPASKERCLSCPWNFCIYQMICCLNVSTENMVLMPFVSVPVTTKYLHSIPAFHPVLILSHWLGFPSAFAFSSKLCLFVFVFVFVCACAWACACVCVCMCGGGRGVLI